MAWQWVSRYFPQEATIPFTNWTAKPELLWHIINTIQLNKYNSILEFGGGISTIVIANLLRQEGNAGKITCVESDAEWAARLQKNLDQFNLKNVEIILAPISPGHYNPAAPWFSLQAMEKLKTHQPFELVFVDGPSGLLGSMARVPAIPWLIDNQLLAPNHTIILDDYNRPDEKQIGEQWGKLTGHEMQSFGSYAIASSDAAFQPLPFTYAQL